jgi:starvation-inducible DNA-binding protein
MTTTSLSDQLKVLLASSFSFYLKTHGFHFNVSGPNFPQYHALFQTIYEEVYDSVDQLGEIIRTLDSFTPMSLTRFAELTVIQDQVKIPRAELMLQELETDCATMIQLLNSCFAAAESENKQDVANTIAERLGAFNKHRWMLAATLNRSRQL